MKKFYQPRGGKKGPFALRENTYRRTWYLIADYPYYKAIQQGWIDGMVSGDRDNKDIAESSGIAETVFEYDVNNDQCEKYIWAIEEAIAEMPPLYVKYILSHIIDKRSYKEMDGISERSLKMWVQRFIWHVAHNLGDA